MKKIILSISLLFLFSSLNGQLIKICDGGLGCYGETIKICDGGIGCYPTETIKICDGGIGCYPTKNLFISSYEVYDELISKDNNLNITNIKICDGGIGCYPTKTIKICDGGIGCYPTETIRITDNIKEADIIIFVDEDLINSFSDFPMYKTILKNYLSQTSPPSQTSQYSTTGYGFKTKIDKDNDDILKLDNGAIVEIDYGYLGYLGYRKDCIVYKSGSIWKIWIEGKKSFSCTILKEPSYTSKTSIEEVYISKVSDDGEFIFLDDGSVYEVSYQSYETSLWLGYSSALLINGYQIINLDEGSEMIDVVKIK